MDKLKRLIDKLEAEKIHGNPQNAERLTRIISETEEKINEMQSYS